MSGFENITPLKKACWDSWSGQFRGLLGCKYFSFRRLHLKKKYLIYYYEFFIFFWKNKQLILTSLWFPLNRTVWRKRRDWLRFKYTRVLSYGTASISLAFSRKLAKTWQHSRWPYSSSSSLSTPLRSLTLSGPLARRECDLSNVLGLLSQVRTRLPVCLSDRFSPLPHGLSLWILRPHQNPSSSPHPKGNK